VVGIGLTGQIEEFVGLDTMPWYLAHIAFLGFVAFKLRTGRGWVRILFIASYAFGVVGNASRILMFPSIVVWAPLTIKVIALSYFFSQSAAVVLMYNKSANSWIRATQSAR